MVDIGRVEDLCVYPARGVEISYHSIWADAVKKTQEFRHRGGLISKLYWVIPLPSNSNHQGYSVFSRESL